MHPSEFCHGHYPFDDRFRGHPVWSQLMEIDTNVAFRMAKMVLRDSYALRQRFPYDDGGGVLGPVDFKFHFPNKGWLAVQEYDCYIYAIYRCDDRWWLLRGDADEVREVFDEKQASMLNKRTLDDKWPVYRP